MAEELKTCPMCVSTAEVMDNLRRFGDVANRFTGLIEPKPKSSELKPCPFCNSEAFAVEYVSALKETRIKSVVGLGGIEHKEPYEAVLGVVIVGLAGCSSCKAQVEAYEGKDDEPGTAKAAAIKAWNTRVV